MNNLFSYRQSLLIQLKIIVLYTISFGTVETLIRKRERDAYLLNMTYLKICYSGLLDAFPFKGFFYLYKDMSWGGMHFFRFLLVIGQQFRAECVTRNRIVNPDL
jgi:hypothetical protein